MSRWAHFCSLRDWQGTDSSKDPTRPSLDGRPAKAMLEGPELVEALHGSDGWARVWAAVEAASVPAPGSKPFAFDAVFARTFPSQLRIVLGRTWRSYTRAVGYNASRIKILFFLNLLFGTVWYKAQQAVDCAPAQAADAFVCANTPDSVQSIGSSALCCASWERESIACVPLFIPG